MKLINEGEADYLMKETYYLNEKEVPTIPVPHDCVVQKLQLEKDSLILVFENDISYHDGIKSIRPNVKSLIIKSHFVQDVHDINLFVRSKTNRFLHKSGAFNEVDLTKEKKTLLNLANNNLEYLYHNVGYCSIIVKLWSENDIVLDITADYVEFEWIE